MVSLEKWMILTPLQKLPKNGEDWGKLFVAKGFKMLPKVQNITQSGHTGHEYLILSRRVSGRVTTWLNLSLPPSVDLDHNIAICVWWKPFKPTPFSCTRVLCCTFCHQLFRCVAIQIHCTASYRPSCAQSFTFCLILIPLNLLPTNLRVKYYWYTKIKHTLYCNLDIASHLTNSDQWATCSEKALPWGRSFEALQELLK